MQIVQTKQILYIVLSLVLTSLVVSACKVADNQSNLQRNASPQPVSSTILESKEQTPKADIQPLDKDVTLNFKVETNGSRKPKIVGDTNLPDGTELMFSIEGKSVGYNAQDKTVVQGGRFQSNIFTVNNNEIDAGQYRAEVLMPIPTVQPPTVRAVIGEKGENLKGSLVKKGSLGITVSVEQPFQLKADGTVSLAENKSEIINAERNAFAVFEALKRLEQQGRDMESLRSSKSIENIKECGNLMRERQPKADDLRSKAESLPQPFTTLLTPAAIESKLCVSCASFAMDNCNRAKSSLDLATKEMQKNK